MEECGIGFDAGGQQCVHQAIVIGDALFVGVAEAIREDPRPGDRETVGLHAQRLHELDVLREAMVLIDRDIAGLALGYLAGLVRKGIPDRGFASVLLGGAFHLVGSGGASPQEGVGEAAK